MRLCLLESSVLVEDRVNMRNIIFYFISNLRLKLNQLFKIKSERKAYSTLIKKKKTKNKTLL